MDLPRSQSDAITKVGIILFFTQLQYFTRHENQRMLGTSLRVTQWH